MKKLLINAATMASLGVMFAPIAHAMVYTDNFNDGTLNGLRWIANSQGGGTIGESNGRLNGMLPASPSGPQISATYQGNQMLIGDFDIQVEYRLDEWPLTLTGARLGVGAWNDTFGCNVSRTNYSPGNGETYYFHVPPQLFGTPTSDMQGKLRLQRVGNVAMGSQWNGTTWVTVGAVPMATFAPATFSLSIWSDTSVFGYRTVRASFDNFVAVDQGKVPVSGLVNLNDYVGNVGVETVNFVVYDPKGNMLQEIQNVALDTLGRYTLWLDNPGRVNLTARGRTWLPQTASDVLVPEEGRTDVEFRLVNGDADRSGEVDAADLDTVIAHFGETFPGEGYVDADLDGSGEVDAADLDIVLSHFGEMDQ